MIGFGFSTQKKEGKRFPRHIYMLPFLKGPWEGSGRHYSSKYGRSRPSIIIFWYRQGNTFASICIVSMKSYSQAMWWYDMLGCCDLLSYGLTWFHVFVFFVLLTRHTLLTSFLDNFKKIALTKSFRMVEIMFMVDLSVSRHFCNWINDSKWLVRFCSTRSACPKMERSSKNGRICAIV